LLHPRGAAQGLIACWAMDAAGVWMTCRNVCRPSHLGLGIKRQCRQASRHSDTGPRSVAPVNMTGSTAPSFMADLHGGGPCKESKLHFSKITWCPALVTCGLFAAVDADRCQPSRVLGKGSRPSLVIARGHKLIPPEEMAKARFCAGSDAPPAHKGGKSRRCVCGRGVAQCDWSGKKCPHARVSCVRSRIRQ
jgi:hypothetical protein